MKKVKKSEVIEDTLRFCALVMHHAEVEDVPKADGEGHDAVDARTDDLSRGYVKGFSEGLAVASGIARSIIDGSDTGDILVACHVAMSSKLGDLLDEDPACDETDGGE